MFVNELELKLSNTNPNGTEDNVSGRSTRACVSRESKREESGGVGAVYVDGPRPFPVPA